MGLEGYLWWEITCRTHSPCYLLGCMGRKKYGGFEGVEEDIDKIGNKLFQTLVFSVMGLYSLEEFWRPNEILMNI